MFREHSRKKNTELRRVRHRNGFNREKWVGITVLTGAVWILGEVLAQLSHLVPSL